MPPSRLDTALAPRADSTARPTFRRRCWAENQGAFSPWLRVSWLIAPNERLGGTSPLESLEHVPETVLLVAKGVGAQGGA